MVRDAIVNDSQPTTYSRSVSCTGERELLSGVMGMAGGMAMTKTRWFSVGCKLVVVVAQVLIVMRDATMQWTGGAYGCVLVAASSYN